MPHAERVVVTTEPAVVLVGGSLAARRLNDEITSAADAPCVLIEGEAGLDSQVVASAIHTRGRRTGGYVAIECRGVKAPLIERLLFGAVRRVAKDVEAVAANSALAQAGGGTLYLGDVCELPAGAQARIARIARDGEVRIDGAAAPVRVAIVAATSIDLEARVEEGAFHRDLLDLFSQSRVAVPALRRRSEDLPFIITALVAERCGDLGQAVTTVMPAAMTLLAAMPWPGNLVELRQAISQLVSAAASHAIQVEDVLAHVHFHAALAPHTASGTLRAARRQFERDYIALIIRQHHGRVGEAARTLGIQRTNLYRKARQLGISVARPVQS